MAKNRLYLVLSLSIRASFLFILDSARSGSGFAFSPSYKHCRRECHAIYLTRRFSSPVDDAFTFTEPPVTDIDATTNEATLRSVTFRNIAKHQNPDLLCDFLMEIGACSTSITDANANNHPSKEEPLLVHGEPTATYNPWQPRGRQVGDDTETSVWVEAPVWNDCTVTAHFADGIDLAQVLELVQDTFADMVANNDEPVVGVSDLGSSSRCKNDYRNPDIAVLPNQDWLVKVQQGWKPIMVRGGANTNIVLRFPWHTRQDVDAILNNSDNETYPSNKRIELELQGGIAFGTGEHATTQLCLEWIDQVIHNELENSPTRLTVLDYGAGSGVLGMGACAMAPDQISSVGIEIDFDSCRIANANAVQNRVNMKTYLPPLSETADDESKSMLLKAYANAQGRLQECGDGGSDVFLPQSLEGKQYDIAVANILAGPLITLAPTLASMTKVGGRMGLSGILPHQGEDVADAYRRAGFEDASVVKEMNGWVLVTGSKSEVA
jgi:ribosomal protein L11 methylase PrmA